MGKTKIEWTDETWNPVTGCTKVSEGCCNCYAERMARRLAGRCGYPAAPKHFDVSLHPGRLEQPLRWKKPRMIFVCSMGDLFHEDVGGAFITEVWDIMRRTPQHTYQVLTKRPEQMARDIFRIYAWAHCEPLPNVWLGVSVESPDYLWRIDELMKCPAAVRFVSLEPLLGPIDLSKWLRERGGGYFPIGLPRQQPSLPPNWHQSCLDWIIVGGESGPGARPMHPDWARDIRDQCQAAGVPFFFKQWGAWRPDSTKTYKRRAGRLLDGRTWDEMPGRQED